MKRRRRKPTDEFEQETVRLIREGGKAMDRALERARFQETIGLVFDESRKTDRSPRVRADLADMVVKVSKSRVERETRDLGLGARRPKKLRVTTDSERNESLAENAGSARRPLACARSGP